MRLASVQLQTGKNIIGFHWYYMIPFRNWEKKGVKIKVANPQVRTFSCQSRKRLSNLRVFSNHRRSSGHFWLEYRVCTWVSFPSDIVMYNITDARYNSGFYESGLNSKMKTNRGTKISKWTMSVYFKITSKIIMLSQSFACTRLFCAV